MSEQQRTLEKYRRKAATYDESTRLTRLRRRFVDRLRLRPGNIVLDVACGTGLNFALIEQAIGDNGRLIGVDLSPEMLGKARDKVSRNGWHNVILINSPVEEAQIPEQVDAAFFSFTHDVMRSPRALENVMRHVKPNGRVVAAGSKWAPWWAVPVNICVWYVVRQYTTTFEGLASPWTHLSRLVSNLQIEVVMLGSVYIASGTKS